MSQRGKFDIEQKGMILLFIKVQDPVSDDDDMPERFDPSNYTSDEEGDRSEWDDDERKQGYGHVYSRQVYSVDADKNKDEELSDEVENPERAPANPDDITTLIEDKLAFLGRTADDTDPLDEHELVDAPRKQKSLETETCDQCQKSQ